MSKGCVDCDNFNIDLQILKRECQKGRSDFGSHLASGRTIDCPQWEEKNDTNN